MSEEQQPVQQPEDQRTADATPDAEMARAAAKVEKWKRHLLDLSNFNRLLNYRDTAKTAAVLCRDLAALEDRLADGVEFQLLPEWEEPKPADGSPEKTGAAPPPPPGPTPEEDFADKRLRLKVPAKDCGKRLLGIYREARNVLQDSGANVLFLALGFLHWKDSEAKDAVRRAPIILLPLELRRQGGRDGFSVRMADDEPRVNSTLLEKLRCDMGIDVPGCAPLPLDDSGLDTAGIFALFRAAVAGQDGWEVREEAAVGLFSFTKYLMWRDLNDNPGLLLASPLPASLIKGTPLRQPEGGIPEPSALDAAFPSARVFCPASADSSQLAAVQAAAAGRSFVMDGPPGTGKSQTIVNMIAHCLASGKSVLFVAEKAAALNVVQQRLRDLGLDRYCLALHSRKAQKREVVEQLRNAWQAEHVPPPENWAALCAKLDEVKARLNRHCQALHAPRGLGRSLYQALSRVIAYRRDGVPDKPLPLPWSAAEIARHDAAFYAALRDRADELQKAAVATGGIADNPWRDSGFSDWLPVASRRVAEEALEAAREGFAAYAPAAERAGKIFPEGCALPFDQAESPLDSLRECLRTTPRARPEAYLGDNWETTRTLLNEAAAHAETRQNCSAQLSAVYRPDFAAADLDALSRRCREIAGLGFIGRFFAKRRIRSEVMPFVLPGKGRPSFDRVHAAVDTALRLRDADRWLADKEAERTALFAPGARPESSASVVAWMDAFKTAAAALSAGTNAPENFTRRLAAIAADASAARAEAERLDAELAAWRSAAEPWNRCKDSLAAALVVDRGGLESLERNGELDAKIRLWQTSLDRLPAWANWLKERERAAQAGLAAVADDFVANSRPPERIAALFDASYLSWWLEGELGRDPQLAAYGVAGLTDDVAAFGRLDAEYLELSKQAVLARLCYRAETARTKADAGTASLLRHQFGLKQRFMPIRRLMNEAGSVIRAVMPCFLMSPISAAQYLDIAAEPFDVVIFDEASQIPSSEAAGVMARGRQAVVAGDPQQLPPTTFFQRQANADAALDDDDYADLESLLDDCLAAGMGRATLDWHYRSRNESLIAFSNRRYYGGRLQTFPGPNRKPGVSLIHVDGVYDRAKTRTNPVEAKAVADEVIRRLSDPELSKRSIGVVTLNQSQQNLIEDLLDEARADRRDLDAFFDDAAPAPVFVKNLENVQGDERDVVILGICYGPDDQGRVAMNFGPLNREGGQRRLNVAVTRAKYEVMVFSSLSPERIDRGRSSARGVADLRDYLEFARSGVLPPAPDAAVATPASADDGLFADAVADAVRGMGYEAVRDVGFSGYRVDVGVVDPDRPGEYLLGIECDGPNYRGAQTARDRDRLRALILKGLGWRLCRAWSEEWFEKRGAPAAAIEEALGLRTQRLTEEVKAAAIKERK